MRRSVGLILMALGFVTASFGLAPWLQFLLIERKRYHYYYIPNEAIWNTIAFLGLGVSFVSLGAWLAFHRNQPGNSNSTHVDP